MSCAKSECMSEQQRALVDRLVTACGGSYATEIRRRYFISGPQWAAAYEGQALFDAPTRQPVSYDEVIREYARIGIGFWATNDTGVFPAATLLTDHQWEIINDIHRSLEEHGLRCSMVTTETFHHPVWAASAA